MIVVRCEAYYKPNTSVMQSDLVSGLERKVDFHRSTAATSAAEGCVEKLQVNLLSPPRSPRVSFSSRDTIVKQTCNLYVVSTCLERQTVWPSQANDVDLCLKRDANGKLEDHPSCKSATEKQRRSKKHFLQD